MAGSARPMTRKFRNHMLRRAVFVFAVLIAVLLILVGTVGSKGFFIAAVVLIPAAALSFNFIQRRAYAAEQQGLKR